MRLTLRWKILLSTSVLVLALIVATLAFVSVQANAFVSEQIEKEIAHGKTLIRTAESERLASLRLTAELVASFPELKALLSTDSATVRDFLISYQQQSGISGLLIALDPAGRVVARTDTEAADSGEIDTAELRNPKGDRRTGLLRIDGGVYHVAIAPAAAGGTVFGWLMAASRIDDGFARSLQQDMNESDIAIVADTILGSTVPASRFPWQSRQDWEAVVGLDAGYRQFAVAGERYAGAGAELRSDGPIRPLAIVFLSQDRALAPYRRIQFGLLGVGLLVAVAGIVGIALLSRTITAPVAKLSEGTRQVAAGNFDYRLDIASRDEIGDLASSFNTMIQGLRERADFQKFVSQSTVDMIQAKSVQKTSAGEKVTLTILFSDMRGFTAMSETRPPEDVVRILNACLGLQAEKVKKFRGDIDKYVGDCVVALFTGEDMELNAIRCAVEIHRAIQAHNTSQPEGERLHVGIGIATGEVILGNIGSPDRLDYTVIGSHVNLSSRLCSLAGPGETLLAESTYSRVEGLVAAERLEPLKVKGFTNPVPVFRMVRS